MVLITVSREARQRSPLHLAWVDRAIELLLRPDVLFISSPYLRLELLPKPTAYQQVEQVRFIQTYADGCRMVPSTNALRDAALKEACELGLGAMDALHLASAAAGKADFFVTCEDRKKPMFKSKLVKVRHLLDFGDSAAS